jgi:hypothetical protein
MDVCLSPTQMSTSRLSACCLSVVHLSTACPLIAHPPIAHLLAAFLSTAASGHQHLDSLQVLSLKRATALFQKRNIPVSAVVDCLNKPSMLTLRNSAPCYKVKLFADKLDQMQGLNQGLPVVEVDHQQGGGSTFFCPSPIVVLDVGCDVCWPV